MRKFLVGFLFLLLVAPASSSSVGFGEVNLQSFLNQPLRAEIPLRGASGVADSLRIRQASEDAYRRAGLNRGSVPGDLNIQLDGDRVILTTRRPVREPYVGILLEARWDGGRAMREVSLLLDPPGTMPSGASAPSVSQADAAAPRTPRAGETLQVRSGDTLYAIVRRSGISGYSDEQAMLAFLDANPQAFIGNNINTLRADAELRTPSREQLEARSAAAARAEVADQTRSWQESARAAREEPEPAPADDAVAAAEDDVSLEDDAAAVEDEETVAAEESEPAAEDDAAAVADTDTAAAEDVPAVAEESVADEGVEDRLEIVADLLPEDAEAGVAQGGSEELLQEALLSQRAEMEGMREELSELREELGERGRLAEISSENMAELEEQLSQLRAEREQLRTRLDRADAERNAPLHERIMNDPLLLMMAIALVVLLLLVLLAFARGGRREVMVDERGAGLKPRADNSKVQASGVESAGYEAKEVDHTEGSHSAMAGAATGAAAGTIMGAAAARSDDETETTQEESAHPPAEPEEEVGEVVVASTSEGAAGMDDVLAEVDVCLAYGMNDQAVETLNAALETSPDNKQYRLKLVEAHVALEDEAGAREAANALRERLGPDDDEMRDRLSELESRLGSSAGSAGDAAADSLDDAVAGDDSGSADADADSNEIDFSGLDLPDVETSDTSEATEGTPAGDDEGLSFDIDENLEDDLASAAEADRDEAASGDDLNNLSFDLDDSELPDLDAPASGGDSGETEDSGLSMDEDLQVPGEPSAAAGDEAGTGDDENVTRLSLAQAYADMGDAEGAQELIDEVLASGTDEQKQEAEAIRSQIQGS
ncbi:FimV/HubP family polar landmark protein [Thioalkalivibrio sp. ALE17]|uniref:FimV/HubP family polar landmark protein n=1 Tax=Thioalkalivibrio sp. ALE17 TaxID=1158173 RepID=UPI000413D297|nr:FimV/HubP family polar landmark protein [Thioalkalivibrio sp. ALE17]